MNTQLLASSASLDGMTKLINEYWCGESYTINPETLTIEGLKHPEDFRIIKKRKRYRFEVILKGREG